MTIKSLLAALRRLIDQPFTARANAAPPLPVMACHFFGDHSPLGFWDDQQLDRVPDLLRIVNENGFNTIILVVPFEPFIHAQPDTGMNEWYWARLKSVLHMAAEAKLSAILRLAYLNSTSPDNQTWVVKRQMRLLDQQSARLWLNAYFKKVAAVAKRSKAYAGSFIAWEDFWLLFEQPPTFTDDERLRIAAKVGLSTLAVAWKDDGQLQEILGADSTLWPTAIVPRDDSPACVLWMKWFDHFLFGFIGGSAKRFLPDIAFEVRADGQPINMAGETVWARFELRRDTAERRYGYWGAFYGAANTGELVTEFDALRSLNYFLDIMNGEGMCADIVLEQFNIVDNTIDFAGSNARISPSSLPRFLEAAAPIIAARTSGYGLWTYRNYRENWFSNAGFQRQCDGWITTQKFDVTATHAHAAHWLILPGGSSIQQNIHGILRLQASLANYPAFNFLIRAQLESGDAVEHRAFTITIADVAVIADGCDHGRLRYAVPASAIRDGIFLVSIHNTSAATLKITDVSLYAYKQIGGLYDANENELPMADLIRQFNTNLRDAFKARVVDKS